MKCFKILVLVLWFPLSMNYGQSYEFQAFWETKKGKAHEVAVLGIKDSDFQKAFDLHTKEGLELSLIDGYDMDGKVYLNGLFKTPSGKDQMARFGETANRYQRYFDRYIKNGDYRLVWLDSYRKGNSIRYAFIFTKKKGGGQKAYHGLTREQHQQRFDQWAADGWDPINVSVVSMNGTRYYTAFYEKRAGGFTLKSFMTRNDFETANAEQKEKGKQLAYMNAYTHDQNTLPRFVAIWRTGSGDRKYLPNVYGPTVMAKGNELGTQGYFTRFVTGYGVGQGHRFDTSWFKPKANAHQIGGIKMEN